MNTGEEKLLYDVPNVPIEQGSFDSRVTYKDFEQLNGSTPNQQENELSSQILMNKELNHRVKTRSHTDITEVNNDIINAIENNDLAEYIPSKVVTDEYSNDLMEALHHLADDNNAYVQNVLGICYFSGINVQIDEQRAMEYFADAAQQSYAPAERNLAIMYENMAPPDLSGAVSLYERAAKEDDKYALNNLAVCYLMGKGIKKDVKQAIKYFTRAVKMGDDFAMLNLADCYAVGNGVHRNERKAFELYKQAADKGNADGIKSLADCYYNGKGINQNLETAMEYYRKAAESGSREAHEMYEILLQKITPISHSIHSDITASLEEIKKSKSLDDVLSLSEKATNKSNKETDKIAKGDEYENSVDNPAIESR